MPKRRVSSATSGGRLAAAEHERVGGRVVGQQRGIELAVGCGMTLHGCEVREVDAHHAGADRAAPALAIGSVGAMPASRIACSAAASAKRCERLANLTSLRSAVITRSSKPFTSAAMRVEKPLRVEQRDRRGAARPAVEHRPRRRDVVADRRDEADAGDRDAALVAQSWCTCISSRAPPTTRPSVVACSVAFATPSSGGCERRARGRAAAPGAMNERILTCVMRSGRIASVRRRLHAREIERLDASACRAAASPETPAGAESDR